MHNLICVKSQEHYKIEDRADELCGRRKRQPVDVDKVRLHRSQVEIKAIVLQEAQEGLDVAGVTVPDRTEPGE